VAKNSGFTPLYTWESPMSLLNLEFLGTTTKHLRDPLEKNGHGPEMGLRQR
jgi:hypothetical protein